jgi:hypothetical protein
MPVSSIGYFTEQGASMVGVGGPMDLYDPSRIVPFWRQWQCRICGEVRFVEGTSASHPPLRACAWCGKEGSDWVSVDVDLKDKPFNICCRKQPPKVAPVRVPAGTFPRGNHKALLIGLNYYGQGTDLELKGSIQDVHAMTQFLTFQGWHTDADHLRVLVDDRSTPLPTRQAIVEGIQWLMAGADPGSNLFLQFSGQGVPEESCLLTADLDVLLEEELWELLAVPLPRGARLTCLFDSFLPMNPLRMPKYYAIQAGNVTSHALRPWDRKLDFPADIVTFYAAPTPKPFKEGLGGRLTGAVFHAFIATMIEQGTQGTHAEVLAGMERTLWRRRFEGTTIQIGCLEPREFDPLARLTLYADHSALQKLNEAQITALLDLTPDLPADPILMEGAGAANAPKPPCGHSNCSDRDCCRVFQQYNARRRPQTSLAMVPVL